ncbi:alpha/beta-hydrolase [Schizopora paradoxa]|uniref:Alpha/beta-hydrolase n=1 Tax=Schizopora paradoxa TaxID=27342 RepID=A0A0H2RCK8_9AGAM|nr:alpha/beta-hydrolase [Schizopora paradoxa]
MPRVAVRGDDKFALFSISTFTYKVVDEHPILADVLIPKGLLALDRSSSEWTSKRPLMIRIHGGALVGGQRDYAPWCTGWLLSLALQHNAVIVAPDYRVIPESTVLDLLDDLDDFMQWIEKDLPSEIQNSTRSGDGKYLDVDPAKTLIAGDSGGGYCAIQMALSHFESSRHVPSAVKVRALVAIYPMLNLRAPHWTKSYPKYMMGAPPVPESVIDDHLATIRALPRKPVVTNAPVNGTSRGLLGLALFQHGRMGEFYGVDNEESNPSGDRVKRLHPEDRLKEGAKLPPTFFVHGANDSVVPVHFTDDFIELGRRYGSFVTRNSGNREAVMYAKVEGEHGFDYDLDPEEELWIKEGLDFIQESWLS